MSSGIVEAILLQNGGIGVWEAHRFIQFRLRFGGLAFASRWNTKGHRKRRAYIAIHEQQTIFEDFPQKGFRAIWTPSRVAIERVAGMTIKERKHPRDYFHSFKRQLWWDDLDLLYFAGYATWNYLMMPYLLSWEGIVIESISDWKEQGENWTKLDVSFPDTITTHSTYQAFYFDQQGRLCRHDYDPKIFASWAKAAHYCSDHVTVSGVQIPRKRTVVPRRKHNKTARFPILVWIKLFEVTFCE